MTPSQTHAFSQFPAPGQPGQPGFGNPYSDYAQLVPPPKKSKTWLWILLIVGGLALAVCLACGGLIYVTFTEGVEVFEQELIARLNSDPAAQKHLGTVQSVKFDLLASTKETNENDGDQVFLFHVKGSQGSADLVGVPDHSGTQGITDARLILPSGEEVDLSL